jgi:hypothetical protein
LNRISLSAGRANCAVSSLHWRLLNRANAECVGRWAATHRQILAVVVRDSALQRLLTERRTVPFCVPRSARCPLPHAARIARRDHHAIGATWSDRQAVTRRSLINQHALAFITASKTPLPALAQAGKYTSPFFNVFTSLPLGEFTDGEARQLIARGAHCDHPFTPQEQEKLLRLAGRHPYKLQLAGSLLYIAKAQGKPVHWSRLQRDFYHQCEQVGLAKPWRKTIGVRLAAAISWLVVTPATWLGRAMLEGVLRLKKDDVSQSTALMFGTGLIIAMIAILFGLIRINPNEMLQLIERIRGNP